MKADSTLKLTIESENIHVTENITSIIFDEGFDTTNIKSIHIDKNNPVYYIKNSCLINRKTKTVELMWGDFRIPNDEGIHEIGDNAFFSLSDNNPKKLDLVIPEGIIRIGSHAFSNPKITSILLPSSLREIGYRAFAGSSIKEIFIPENVEKIDVGAFHNCQLQKIEVAKDNMFFYSKDNCLIEKNTSRLMACANNPVIPKEVKIIERLVLEGLTDSEYVYLPSLLEEIRKTKCYPKFLQFPVLIETDEYGDETTIAGAMIFVEEGSYGEKYCIKNNLAYIPLPREENQQQ